MKKNIVLLISDDIKISTLVNMLESIGISAYNYYLNNSKVIFSLMGIPLKDETQDFYYKLIELGINIQKDHTLTERKKLAEEIYTSLKTIKKVSKYV